MNLSRDFLVHPMVVLDRNYSILGYLKNPEVSDPIMESILSAGYVTPQIMERLRQNGLISTSEQTENPLISWYSLTTHDCYYSMMYRFKANNHTVGYALIFHCAIHPRTNYLYLMNIVTENLQLFFQQKRFTNRSSSEFMSRSSRYFRAPGDSGNSRLKISLIIFRSDHEWALYARGHPLQRRTGASIFLCQLESAYFDPAVKTVCLSRNTLLHTEK
ncbi:MAG: hypothetical protein ACLUD0_19185 [Eubacterium ramulus]